MRCAPPFSPMALGAAARTQGFVLLSSGTSPEFLDPAGRGLVKKAHQNKKLERSSDPIRIEIVLATAEREWVGEKFSTLWFCAQQAFELYHTFKILGLWTGCG